MKGTVRAVWAVILIASVLTAFPSQLAAESTLVQLRWEELEPLVSGQEVELTLPDSARVRGDVIGVKADSLVMNVEKTSDRGRYPKGPLSIPRTSISSLVMTKRTIGGRVVGTTIGVGLGVLIGTGVAIAPCWEKGCDAATAIALGVGVGFGIGALGHFLGRRGDIHVTTIRIVR